MNNLDIKFIKELSKVMPEDFKDWFQNDPSELPMIARHVIEDLKKQDALGYD